MGTIVSMFTKERVDGMMQDIERLRTQRKYDDMPNVSETLLTMFSGEEYPVPIIGIVKNLGFKVYEMDLEDENLSGMIAIDKKWVSKFGTNKVIIVNQKDSGEHKRFTIAHELAHYLFDSDLDKEYYNTYRTDETQWTEGNIDKECRENVANYFAANILMPSLIFRKKYNELILINGIDFIEMITKDLSEFFGVPETSVKIRYKELGIA